jgi:hypothetical protein
MDYRTRKVGRGAVNGACFSPVESAGLHRQL